MKFVRPLFLSLFLIIPLLMNVVGKNIFVEIEAKENVVIIIGASYGSLHLAYSNMTSIQSQQDWWNSFGVGHNEPEFINSGIFKCGAINCYTVEQFEFQPDKYLHFEVGKVDDHLKYSSLELPLVLLQLFPLGWLLVAIKSKRIQSNKTSHSNPH